MSEKRKNGEWTLKNISRQRVTEVGLQTHVIISVEFERHEGQGTRIWRDSVYWESTIFESVGHPSHVAAMLVELAKRIGDAFELPPEED